ncbi:serine/threonine-protein kinase 36 isoform X2 [Paramormyrops kingsleyae]|uniref:serine/threonine-protein kinase 36 isoform X2 n=1 Tax=Paramormyrops kingsleyae TaxID=1676925 RepID=UPI000CD61A43|nr:serine/threonine-protein kinase 36 isoform X2 [Paramormyrops kingsleyae]
MESYHVLEMIGEGSFGRVYKGRKKFSGQVVALKFIPKVGRSEKELRSLKREIDIMRDLRHPNVILLLDSFETEREVVVVTEHAEGEMFQILEDDGSLPESQVRVIACQLVSALYYLHSHRILHRDMKPQNILLGKGGRVKLCDFGFARAMSMSTLVLTSIKGTPLYMSPELVEEKPYDHTADLWSLGCILYELHTGAPPFYTNSIFQLVQLIIRDPVKWPESMSPDCMSFLKGLLTKDPQKRLSWPDLLEHPFVADGVLDSGPLPSRMGQAVTENGWMVHFRVLADCSPDNPLTVTPSPDLQALKMKQVKERTAPHSGEGRLLRKAREQRAKDKKGKEDFAEHNQRGGRGNCSNKAPLRTAPDGRVPSKDCSVATLHCLDQELERPPTQQDPDSRGQVDRGGQISRDYAKEFPSIEVGPRRVVTAHRGCRPSLDSVRPFSEDIDSDEEWQDLVKTTDPGNMTSATFDQSILPRLRSRLLTSKFQLLEGRSEGACRIRPPLKVLSNLLALGADSAVTSCLTQEGDLPHFLFDLVEGIMGNPVSQQQPWCMPVLGDIIYALIVYGEQYFDWEPVEKRLEERTPAFVTILRDPHMAPLAPLVAALLALFSHRGMPLEVSPDELMAAAERVLSGPAELCLPLPRGWGLFDGILVLLFQTVSERGSCPPSAFPSSCLWRHLWLKIAVASEEGNGACVSLAGLHAFLSLVLFVFTREPRVCVPAFSDTDSGCVETLAHLLSAESGGLSRVAGEGRPARPQISPSPGSLPLTSCHLLCFPLAMDVPEETMGQILQSYHSCDVVSRLLQLCSALPLPLLEVPLSLLCRLLLCDPQRSVPRFKAAAEALGFFHAPGPDRHDDRDSEGGGRARPQEGRTAASLLADLLQSDTFSGSAAELLSLVSQVARCSPRPPLSFLNLDPSLLRSALAHPDQAVRLAACSLLGNLDPLWVRTPAGEQPHLPLFRDLIDQLHDPSVSVRRVVCRAVGTWLGLIVTGDRCEDGWGSFAEGGSPSRDCQGWAEMALEVLPTMMALLQDSDPLVRRHSCAALGNLASVPGGAASLLRRDGPGQLLHVACSDPHADVQEAAIFSLCLFSLQDSLRQSLVSLNASDRLNQVTQNSHTLRRYRRLINGLHPA